MSKEVNASSPAVGQEPDTEAFVARLRHLIAIAGSASALAKGRTSGPRHQYGTHHQTWRQCVD
jgi:hypothetical protein